MRKIKTDLQHKKDYWRANSLGPLDYRAMMKAYPKKPATSGEASYLLNQRWLDLLSQLPFIGKYIK